MKRSALSVFIVLILLSPGVPAQRTQSVIYDAVTIMNAMHQLNALLIPQTRGWDIHNPLTMHKDTSSTTVTPASFFDGSKSKTVILQILARNAGLPVDTTEEAVVKAYQANPFLNSIFVRGFTVNSRDASIGRVGSFKFPSDAGGIGHDVLGNLVNGTADFLIKRAQEEISISVFEKLKQFITRYPELDTLFPETCALIKPVEAYDYHKALDAFKAAIKVDLQNFVSNVPALYTIPRYKQFNQRVPALTLVFTACTLFTELHGEQGLPGSLYNLTNAPYLAETNNYSGFIKVITTISNSLLDKTLSDEEDIEDKSKSISYIHAGFIDKVTNGSFPLKQELGQYYLGLLWQHIQSIPINSGGATQTFASLLNPIMTAHQTGEAIQKVNSLISSIYDLNQKLGTLKKDEAENALGGKIAIRAKRFQLYAGLIDNVMGFSDLFSSASNGKFAIRVTEIAHYIPDFTTGVSNIIRDFHEEEFNLGITEFERLLKVVSDYIEESQKNSAAQNEMLAGLETSLKEQLKNLTDSIAIIDKRVKDLQGTSAATPLIAVDIQAEIQELKRSKETLESSLEAVNYQLKNKKYVVLKLAKVIEYIHLFASITKAENSKAVEQLLETYALPAGSSRIKKVSKFNVAVNAYVGAFGGRSKHMGEGFSNTYGLTAPIGFTISHGWDKAGSISLFLSAFDIGGTIRYKLDNQGKYQQDISLAGIVSPGIHGVYGFPWYLPISLGVGCQWISPTTANSNSINLRATFNAFVAVDIPLFNLAAQKRK